MVSLPNRERSNKWALEFMKRLENAPETCDDKVEFKCNGKGKKKYHILRSNSHDIIDFAKHKMINDNVKPYSMARVVNYLMFFTEFIGNKPFKDVKREDIEAYLNNRKEKGDSDRYMFMLKLSVRSFFKWFYRCEEGYPEVVKWMKCPLPKNSKLPECIEMDEIQKMLKACDNERDKAFISAFYECGGRISEILDLRIRDVKFDNFGAILYVEGKTGGRPIRVVRSTNDLKRWRDLHPFKENEEAPFFCSLSGRNYGGFIDTSSGWGIVRKIAKRAGIERGIHPHMFRHKRASDLEKVLSDREMKIFFGWSPNSNMPALYSHMNAKDVDDKILVINDVKPKDELKPINLPTFECYRCGEINNISNKFCWKCYSPLSAETIEQVEGLKSYISEFITAKLLQKPGFMEELPKLVEEWGKKNQN